MAEFRSFGRVFLLVIGCYFLIEATESFTTGATDYDNDSQKGGLSETSTSTSSSKDKGLSGGETAGVVIGILVLCAAIGGGVYICRRLKLCEVLHVKENLFCNNCCHLNHHQNDPEENICRNAAEPNPQNQLVLYAQNRNRDVNRNPPMVGQGVVQIAKYIKKQHVFNERGNIIRINHNVCELHMQDKAKRTKTITSPAIEEIE
ncbi:hypothetical protein MAR_030758 [Mya arenaria]|uniref:Uncharacterized protein n=1 Tax=Mya arenaria TaxID=6604 RepID=A0ABY7F4P5_MYAAR|nr:hypothetical protein MAR_030758 [Mya arenaria]